MIRGSNSRSSVTRVSTLADLRERAEENKPKDEFPPQQSLGYTTKSLFDIWCLYSFQARQSEDRDTSGAPDDCFL